MGICDKTRIHSFAIDLFFSGSTRACDPIAVDCDVCLCACAERNLGNSNDRALVCTLTEHATNVSVARHWPMMSPAAHIYRVERKVAESATSGVLGFGGEAQRVKTRVKSFRMFHRDHAEHIHILRIIVSFASN